MSIFTSTASKRGGRRAGSGGKPTCSCNQCRLCQKRRRNQASKARIAAVRANEPSDRELEEKLKDYFKFRGWD